jgi:membrane protein required for colicin V production
MNSLDIFILILIAVGFVFGLFKGLVKELTSLAAVFLGIYLSKLFSPWLSQIIMKSWDFSAKIAQPMSYLIIFIAVVIVLLIFARTLDKLFESMSLGGLNKLLGGIFGGLKYALVLSVLLNIFEVIDSKFNFVEPETKSESLVYMPLIHLGPKLWDDAKKLKKDSDEKDVNSESRNEK